MHTLSFNLGMWLRAEPTELSQQPLLSTFFLNVAWISKLWYQYHSRLLEGADMWNSFALPHFGDLNMSLWVSMSGEKRYTKIVSQSVWTGRQVFLRTGSAALCYLSLLGQTAQWFIHLHCLKQLHYLDHNKTTQRRYENPLGCLWVTKESNNFPLHL